MKAVTVVCVGGLLDGQKIALAEGVLRLQVESIAAGPAEILSQRASAAPVPYAANRYRAHMFSAQERDGSICTLHLMASEELSPADVLRALVAGHEKPTGEPASGGDAWGVEYELPDGSTGRFCGDHHGRLSQERAKAIASAFRSDGVSVLGRRERVRRATAFRL